MYYVCETYELFDRFYKKGDLSSCQSASSLIDIFSYLADRRFNREIKSYEIKDMRVKFHSKHIVSNISYNIYLVTLDRCGKENYLKKYHLPQAMCYLVESVD